MAIRSLSYTHPTSLRACSFAPLQSNSQISNNLQPGEMHDSVLLREGRAVTVKRQEWARAHHGIITKVVPSLDLDDGKTEDTFDLDFGKEISIDTNDVQSGTLLTRVVEGVPASNLRSGNPPL